MLLGSVGRGAEESTRIHACCGLVKCRPVRASQWDGSFPRVDALGCHSFAASRLVFCNYCPNSTGRFTGGFRLPSKSITRGMVAAVISRLSGS